VEGIGVEDNFFELGGDSILSIQVVSRAREAGLRLTPRQVFEQQTIERLAQVAEGLEGEESDRGEPVEEGEVPLTPIQAWFFEQELAQVDHWNQAVLLRVDRGVDVGVLERTLEEVVRRHDALRLRFVREGAGWRQRYGPAEGSWSFEREDLSDLPAEGRAPALESIGERLQSSLDIGRGPLLRAAHVEMGEGPGRLLVAIHHLVVDGVSWRILLEDLERAYEARQAGRAVDWPARSSGYGRWARGLAEVARSGAFSEEWSWWVGQAQTLEGCGTLPVDFGSGEDIEGRAEVVRVGLSEEETRWLLQEVPAAYRTEVTEVLLTALVVGLGRWSGQWRWRVDVEGHGREGIVEGVDVTHTVGWFTTIYPVVLGAEPGWGPGESLKAVKEQVRRVPRRGIGYGMLRYLEGESAAARALAEAPGCALSFNYLGQLDGALPAGGWLGWAEESSGPSRGPRCRRTHPLEIDGQVMAGKLEVDWTYGGEVYRRDTVQRAAESFLSALRDLIAHCRSPQAGGYTPSDFPEADLSQEELDQLLARVEEAAREIPE
jgi:non-ribosomal peptide synthase protein (TIGR01720 family)